MYTCQCRARVSKEVNKGSKYATCKFSTIDIQKVDAVKDHVSW